jgi:hypothetical protein
VSATLGCDQLIILLNAGISQRSLYFDRHPKVLAASERFVRRLGDYLDASGRDMLFLGVAEGKLVHDGRSLVGSTVAGKRLIELAGDLACGGFLFKRRLTAAEVRALFELAAGQRDAVRNLDEARELLAASGVQSIDLSPPFEDAGWFGQFLFDGQDGAVAGPPDLDSMMPVCQSLYSSVEAAHADAGSGADLDLDGVRTVSESLTQATRGDFTDLMQLVQYPDYDSYTVGHSVRVALLLVMVGHGLGLEREALLELSAVGLLHDVGKSRVPEEILFKPGRLDAEERRAIERHAPLGARILLENRDAGPLAVAAAWGHHQRHDGGGYPIAPPWAFRDRVTSLLHVCDVYEALTAVRPYKQALSPRRAFEIMLGKRGDFDPALLTAFVRALGLYPPGSLVRLVDGRRAVVLAAGPDIERPRLRLTHEADGLEIAPDDAPMLDLAGPEGCDAAIAGIVQEAAPVTAAHA